MQNGLSNRGPACAVCGSREVRTDAVEQGGWLLLAECPRCDHRWTQRARARRPRARPCAWRRPRCGRRSRTRRDTVGPCGSSSTRARAASARRRRRRRPRSSRRSAGCARWSRRPTSRTASATCSDARLGPEPHALAPRLFGLEIDPRVESARHWGRIQRFLERTFRHQGIEAAVAEELAMLPGAEELTTLLAVEQLAESRRLRPARARLRAHRRGAAPRDAARGGERHGAARAPARGRVLGARGAAREARRGGAAARAARCSRRRRRCSTAISPRCARGSRRRRTTVRLVVTPERMVIDEARRALHRARAVRGRRATPWS